MLKGNHGIEPYRHKKTKSAFLDSVWVITQGGKKTKEKKQLGFLMIHRATSVIHQLLQSVKSLDIHRISIQVKRLFYFFFSTYLFILYNLCSPKIKQ